MVFGQPLQLNPVIVVTTPKGKAVAHFLIDYGYEHDLYWVCFQHDTGECWTWNNKDIRIDNNSTIGRNVKDLVKDHSNGVSKEQSRESKSI